MQKRLYKKAESYPLTDDSLLFVYVVVDFCAEVTR